MKTVIIVGVIAVVLIIATLVAALCKVAGKESSREEKVEKEHPCAYCQRWGECNGVDESCPLIQAYEETR